MKLSLSIILAWFISVSNYPAALAVNAVCDPNQGGQNYCCPAVGASGIVTIAANVQMIPPNAFNTCARLTSITFATANTLLIIASFY